MHSRLIERSGHRVWQGCELPLRVRKQRTRKRAQQWRAGAARMVSTQRQSIHWIGFPHRPSISEGDKVVKQRIQRQLWHLGNAQLARLLVQARPGCVDGQRQRSEERWRGQACKRNDSEGSGAGTGCAWHGWYTQSSHQCLEDWRQQPP